MITKNILFEDESIIVVCKPAGIATQTARIGQQDMVSELKNYLSAKPEYRGKGEPYLGLVHRLDQPVSGILVFAKTRQAAAKLSRQAAGNTMRKYYYAVVFGKPPVQQECLEDFLHKDGKTNRSLVVQKDFPDAKDARLEYRLLKTLMILEAAQEVSLLEVQLFTGRHHQIRVQLSHAGMPLLGDGKYGSELSKQLSMQAGCKNVALCAYKLVFRHPQTGRELTFEKQPKEDIFLPFFSREIL